MPKPIRLTELLDKPITQETQKAVPTALAVNLNDLESSHKSKFKSALTAADSIYKSAEKVVKSLTEVTEDAEASEREKSVANILLSYFEDVCNKMTVVCEKVGDEKEPKLGDDK
jgi:hypothetical protein